jgi:hypothetical protein
VPSASWPNASAGRIIVLAMPKYKYAAPLPLLTIYTYPFKKNSNPDSIQALNCNSSMQYSTEQQPRGSKGAHLDICTAASHSSISQLAKGRIICMAMPNATFNTLAAADMTTYTYSPTSAEL